MLSYAGKLGRDKAHILLSRLNQLCEQTVPPLHNTSFQAENWLYVLGSSIWSAASVLLYRADSSRISTSSHCAALRKLNSYKHFISTYELRQKEPVCFKSKMNLRGECNSCHSMRNNRSRDRRKELRNRSEIWISQLLPQDIYIVLNVPFSCWPCPFGENVLFALHRWNETLLVHLFYKKRLKKGYSLHLKCWQQWVPTLTSGIAKQNDIESVWSRRTQDGLYMLSNAIAWALVCYQFWTIFGSQ